MRPASSILLFATALILALPSPVRAQFANRSRSERIQTLARNIERGSDAILREGEVLYPRTSLSDARARQGLRSLAREASDFRARLERRTFVEADNAESFRSLLSAHEYARAAMSTPAWSRNGRRAIDQLRDDMQELREIFRSSPRRGEVWPYERLYAVANDVETRAERLLNRARVEDHNGATRFAKGEAHKAIERLENLAEESEELRKTVQKNRDNPAEAARQLDKVIDRWQRARDGLELFGRDIQREHREVWEPIAELQRFFSARPRYGRD